MLRKLFAVLGGAALASAQLCPSGVQVYADTPGPFFCCADSVNCPLNYPTGFSSFMTPNCPNARGTSSTYTSEYADCLQTSAMYTCVWDGWNAIQSNTYWTLQSYRWANLEDICGQLECEAHALWSDCLRKANTDGACTIDFSLCQAEDCKPNLVFGDRVAGTVCTADSECLSGRCSGICMPPSAAWGNSLCYNKKLEPSDDNQWAGCTAADSTSTYASALPAATWRDLRDNTEAQKALCDNDAGRMATTGYKVARVCPSERTPNTLAYSEPSCRLTLPTSAGTAMVEAEVAEEYFEVVCDQAGDLISVCNDNDITVDITTQEACYAARDQMNGLGIALGQKCYAQCDPDSSATLALSALLLALF